MWFECLFGIREAMRDFAWTKQGLSKRELYEATQSKFKVVDRGDRELRTTSVAMSPNDILISPNGREFEIGEFKTPSLRSLRESDPVSSGKLRLSCVSGEASALQARKDNKFATFQVASQFNCLEMPHFSVTREDGIDAYETDKTQGPACSIGAGAATFARNYLISAVDTISGFFSHLGIDDWIFTENGYAGHGCTDEDLDNINEVLEDIDVNSASEELLIGVHYDVEVTSTDNGTNILNDPNHKVTQVFSSALAVGYNSTCKNKTKFEPLAKLVLSATYEATLRVAERNMDLHHSKFASNRVYLTLVGGGVFDNKLSWIVEAIRFAVYRMCDVGLDVRIVLFNGNGEPVVPEEIKNLIAEFERYQQAELMRKRSQLSSEIDELVRMIKKTRKTEEEEYHLSIKCGVPSVQDDYHDVPMPALGTISTYSGPMASNWAMIPEKVASAFCPFDDDQ